MPACVKCGRVDATAEMRRRRGHPGEFTCLDAGRCRHRANAAKAELRAANLSQRNRRRIELALEQLVALRDDVGVDVFEASPLAHVRDAYTNLLEHVVVGLDERIAAADARQPAARSGSAA